jgi:hypothetical protein
VQTDLSVMSSNHVAQPPLSPPAPPRAEAPPLSAAPVPPPEPVAPTFAVAPTPELSPQAVAPPSAPPAFVAPQPALHRVRVRLTTGDAIEVAAHEDEAAARSEATALMRYLRDGRGDWPFLAGRFVRPETIVSIDLDGSPA